MLTKIFIALLALTFATSGCSSASRQERAYRKYVRQQQASRDKQQRRRITEEAKIPESQPSQPMISSDTTHDGS